MPVSMYPDKNLLFVRYVVHGVVFNLDTFKIEETIEPNKESVKELKVKYPKYFISVKTKKKLKAYILYQFDDSWILIGKVRAGRDFSYSGDIKTHLQMKIDDKVLPINNATFQKYNTEIYLKD
ncbi:hypothetical protein MNB_SM-4-1089 [hydrothermal vent metagenome]|uniref:Uncharacterized protein n=1 Tax=hydrothermal vent metagenome TaxID=652676 RepID=A0A1W1CSM4_9ZZZZ